MAKNLETSKNIRFQRAPGDNWIWGTGAAMASILLMVALLLGVIFLNGVVFFWPKTVRQLTLEDGSKVLGTKVKTEVARVQRSQYLSKTREVSEDEFSAWATETPDGDALAALVQKMFKGTAPSRNNGGLQNVVPSTWIGREVKIFGKLSTEGDMVNVALRVMDGEAIVFEDAPDPMPKADFDAAVAAKEIDPEDLVNDYGAVFTRMIEAARIKGDVVTGADVDLSNGTFELEFERNGDLIAITQNLSVREVFYEDRVQYKVGNRKLHPDFKWVRTIDVTETETPEDAVVLERMEFGNFYGFIHEVHLVDVKVTNEEKPEENFSIEAEERHKLKLAVRTASSADPVDADAVAAAQAALDAFAPAEMHVGLNPEQTEDVVRSKKEDGEKVVYDISFKNTDDLFAFFNKVHGKALAIEKKIEHEAKTMHKLNRKIAKMKLEVIRVDWEQREEERALRGSGKSVDVAPFDARRKAINEKMAVKREESDAIDASTSTATAMLNENKVIFRTVNDQDREMHLTEVVRAFKPNEMGLGSKVGFYIVKIWELLTTNPREANTEGGLLPAIFGTVLMVLLMSIFCMPLGVVAAIYLREYAKEGPLVQTVRVAVNNLAGVPSIVYGVFGLGFFVYKVGKSIDKTFYPHLDAANQHVFGTEGLLWASLTLALLTVPVVIVATEEALAAIPRGMREGSLALGATKWQTVKNVLLPMATPGILTGLILSMARAAGEVAPLMMTGVLKSVSSLPVDGDWPFFHLDRKFMHLGFHIYDMGFKSPNVEAAMPMVFVTTLLLLVIVILMNITAIKLRSAMRRKYTMGAF